MKILKPGVLKPKFWWLGKKFSCKSCGCEFELDESDWKTDDSVFTIPCPTCSTTLRFSKPTPPIGKTTLNDSDLWSLYLKTFNTNGLFESLFGTLNGLPKKEEKKETPLNGTGNDITIKSIYQWVAEEAVKGRWATLDDFFAYKVYHINECPLDVLVAYASATLPYARFLPARKAFVEKCAVLHYNPTLWNRLK